MTFKTVIAQKFYEFEFTAKAQKNGLFSLSCYCTDPDGYYCAHKSYDRKDVSKDEIDDIFNI